MKNKKIYDSKKKVKKDKNKQIKGRQEVILKAIVEEYIDSALPISSSEILNKYNLDISSATVRNEMVELEKNGLITKPYLSSGRIPTGKGYRYYVDKLMNEEVLSENELKIIRKGLENTTHKLDDISKSVLKTVSELTHYTAVALPPKVDSDFVCDVKFVYLSNNILMVLLVTKYGVIKEVIINFEEGLEISVLKNIEKIFKKQMIGKKLSAVDGEIAKHIIESAKEGIEIAKKIIKEINKVLKRKEELNLAGATNTFKLPEFQEEKAKNTFLDLIEDKGEFEKILEKKDLEDELEIYIGEEIGNNSLKEYSVIKFLPSGINCGAIGVVGPKRMNYKKVVQIIKEITKEVENFFGKGKKKKSKKSKPNKNKNLKEEFR